LKKLAVLLLSAVLVLGMTACGSKEKSDADAGNGNKPNVTNNGSNNAGQTTGAGNKESGSQLSVDELIEKSAKAGVDLKSFAMEMKMSQNIVMSLGEDKQEQKIETEISSDFIKDPIQIHQVINIKTPQGDQKMDQYITKEGIFTEANGTWMKLPNEMMDQMIASMEASAQPEKQLDMFKSIAKDTKVTEEGNEYVLTAEISGENVKDLAKELLNQASSGANDQMDAMMEAMNIKSMKITSGVNKETFLPTRSDVNMVMEMEQEGQKISMDMVMTSTISKHNEISEIKVPEEALNAPVAGAQ